MKIFSGLLAACAVMCSVYAEEQDTESGMDRMLRGARVGTTFSAFVESHPEAVYSDEAKRAETVHAEDPGPLLIVHETDPFLGLYSFANFGFKNGALYEMVAVWSGDPETITAKRRRFFTAVLKHHGHSFVQKSMRVFPNTPEERTVAVFFWPETDAAVLAFHTPPSALDPYPKSALTYAVFAPEDPILKDIFAEDADASEAHKKAWQDIADIVDVLE